jgi:tRNA (adenine22-N1)-methyltransferase
VQEKSVNLLAFLIRTHTVFSVCVPSVGLKEGTLARKLELFPRLRLLADWVPPGSRLADIGTDHAFFPVALLLEGRIPQAIACDLRAGPLDRGRETARRWGVSDRIDFRLADGLQAVCPQEADTLSISGMGGENITAILTAAPWAREKTLLLQPQTRAADLRIFLSENGYAILRERLADDRGILYPVFLVQGGRQNLRLGQQYGGTFVQSDPLGGRYLVEQILRLQGIIAGLNKTNDPEQNKKADALREICGALLEEWEEWRLANRT